MRFRFATATEAGPRSANEDAVAVWPSDGDRLAAAIADGLGGYHGGQQASDIAIRMFGGAIGQETNVDLKGLALAIHEAIRHEQQADPKVRGMATTLSGAVIIAGQVHFVHCGDTRIALQRNNGIRRLTVDHTEAQRLLEAGAITREEYASYPRKNVLESALGVSETPRIDVGTHDIMPGDRMFFTSDGVHSKVYLRALRDISVRSADPEDAVRDIVGAVNARGPEDNFTVAAIFID
ncbi:MAG: serine/threonine-protein phosphatase [Sphingomonadaceae bacterium]|nr:serine/threonine-protein phosphatase [Sphingomonadaceae bacterium]